MLSYINIANSEPKHKSARFARTTKSWILRQPARSGKPPGNETPAASA
jgi:hypothetical protein